jgi:hypothetical protein
MVTDVVVDRGNSEVARSVVIKAGAVREIRRTPGRQIRVERERWGEIINAANIKAE